MKKSKFLASVLFSAAIITSNSVSAGSLYSRVATDLDENFQTKITLSFDLPTAEDKDVDVVFLAETGTKNFVGDLYANIATVSARLNELTGSKKANIALVLYGRGSQTIFGLTDAASVNSDFITSALELKANKDWLKDYSFGADLQSGVERAKAILDASTTGAKVSDRHIVVLTDGSATLYNNADGVPANVVFYGSASDLKPMSNMDSNGDVGNPGRNSTSVNLLEAAQGDYAEAFDGLYDRGSEIEVIAAKAYPYVASNYTAEEKADITTKIADNSVSYFTEADVNDITKYPFTSTEIGAYMGAKALDAAADAGYGIHTVGYLYEWGWEDNGEDYILRLIAIPSRGMVEWTDNLGDLYFHQSKTISSADLAEDFNDIAEGMFDTSPLFTVADEVGYGTYADGTPYDFNFVNNLDKISISVDGVELPKEKVSDNFYSFQNDDYQFVFIYEPEEGEYKEAVGFMIRLGKTGRVVVSYYEELSEDTRKTEPGEYADLNASNRSEVRMGEQVVAELEPVAVSYTVGGPSNPKTADDIMFIVIPSVVVLGFAGIVARRELIRRR